MHVGGRWLQLFGPRPDVGGVAQVDEERIMRVRKLPNIVLCRDQHVLRLRGGESLEVTLTDAT